MVGFVGQSPDLKMYYAGADVYLGPNTLVQPDICVFRVDGASPEKWQDFPVPLLAVEVLSPGTASRDRGTTRFVHEAADYMAGQPDTTFFVSSKLRDDLMAIGAADPGRLTLDAGLTADVALFYASEGMKTWHANRRLVDRWFGPYEVNFHRYPTWKGDDRILVMPMQLARALDVQALAIGDSHVLH